MRATRPPRLHALYQRVGQVHWQKGVRKGMFVEYRYLKNWHVQPIPGGGEEVRMQR